MVQGEIEQLPVQLLVPHLHVEYKKFYVNSNARHRLQIFLALQHQQVRLSWHHQHTPDHQQHESSRKFERSLIQIHHELKDR